MVTKTSAEIKQELDDLLLEDTPDAAPWTLARKQRAINRAMRSAWPTLKIPKENASTVTLAAATYKYSLATITDIGDMGNGVGICQVLLEPPSGALAPQSQDWIQLRTVTQSIDGSNWYLYVPEHIVDNNAGRKLKLRYYARPAEFTQVELDAGAGAIPSEFANYVVFSAAVDLFGLYAQGGSDYNVEDILKLIPLYSARAQAELKQNTVYSMPMLVGIRAEASG